MKTIFAFFLIISISCNNIFCGEPKGKPQKPPKDPTEYTTQVPGYIGGAGPCSIHEGQTICPVQDLGAYNIGQEAIWSLLKTNGEKTTLTRIDGTAGTAPIHSVPASDYTWQFGGRMPSFIVDDRLIIIGSKPVTFRDGQTMIREYKIQGKKNKSYWKQMWEWECPTIRSWTLSARKLQSGAIVMMWFEEGVPHIN